MKKTDRLRASFRDPSGHLFTRDGTLYRRLNHSYQSHYDQLMSSGLYQHLVDQGDLISHREATLARAGGYKIIQPAVIPFVSYPYEWSFGQLKDAALLTLEIQKAALEHGMSLKDASAYNIQFAGSRPLLIDTLSFETYVPDQPWGAYRQFCQHFLAPLALASYTDMRLTQLLKVYIDGIPLDLAVKLLPARAKLKPGLAMHLSLHAQAQNRSGLTTKSAARAKLPKQRLLALIDSLESTVKGLAWKPPRTIWGNYYDEHSYEQASFEQKQAVVRQFISTTDPKTAWDLGGNSGIFSRLASDGGATTVSFDYDTAAIEASYQQAKASGESNLLPLVMDLANPSPALGWADAERQSLAERGPVDLVMALALVHHLAIAGNVPLAQIAEFARSLGRHLIIEFVPKPDPMAQRLLAGRPDIFADYHEAGFERAFKSYFEIVDSVRLKKSQRRLYLMQAKA